MRNPNRDPFEIRDREKIQSRESLLETVGRGENILIQYGPEYETARFFAETSDATTGSISKVKSVEITKDIASILDMPMSGNEMIFNGVLRFNIKERISYVLFGNSNSVNVKII